LPWLVLTVAALVATVTYFHVHLFWSIIEFYQQSTFYVRCFLYGILVPALPRHCLGLLLPCVEH